MPLYEEGWKILLESRRKLYAEQKMRKKDRNYRMIGQPSFSIASKLSIDGFIGRFPLCLNQNFY